MRHETRETIKGILILIAFFVIMTLKEKYNWW
jgi:hypothetical protein